MRRNRGEDGLLQWRSQVCRAAPFLCISIAQTEIWKSTTLWGWQKGEPTFWIMCLILKVVSLCVCIPSCVHLFGTPWTIAHPTPLSMGFSRQAGMDCRALLQGIFLAQRSNPHLLCLLHWQAEFFTQAPPGVSLCVGMCVCACMHMWWVVSDSFVTTWIITHQSPLSRQEYLSWFPSSRGSSGPRDWTHVSCTGRQILYH